MDIFDFELKKCFFLYLKNTTSKSQTIKKFLSNTKKVITDILKS